MAFLDNSGDIILDAVLTDTGRFRLAKGNGSFKISKFALGDDEIDYSLYDRNNISGSAYFDLNILQTPILEAFTNNTSTLKSKLLTITRTNLLYLPVMLLNTDTRYVRQASNVFLIAADTDTINSLGDATVEWIDGVENTRKSIRVDQGLDTIQLSDQGTIASDLRETQYIIEIDNRLGKIRAEGNGSSLATESFIDDDNIATYNLASSINASYVNIIEPKNLDSTDPDPTPIRGPRGTKLVFSIKASDQLRTNDYLFDLLGSQTTIPGAIGTFKFIDTSVRITGATTGFRLDVPVRFIKIV